jgi:hypothetical protein
VEAIIGPVRRVLAPRWHYRISVYVGVLPVFLLAFLVLVLLIFCALQLAGVVPPIKDGPWPMLGATLFLGFLTGTAFRILWPRVRLLRSRILVGEGGLVEWTPVGGTLVTADDLGSRWVVHIPNSNNDGLPYSIYLALLHVPSGIRLYLTNFYAGADVIAQLVREKLAERMPGRWADLSRWKPKPVTATGDEITSAEPGETQTTEETP